MKKEIIKLLVMLCFMIGTGIIISEISLITLFIMLLFYTIGFILLKNYDDN